MPVKWSFSGLKQYLNCPKQYHEVKVLRNYEISETPQIIYGKEVHKALEDYVRDGKELPANYKQFQKSLDVLLEINGVKYPEYKMALKYDRTPCDFDADDYWVRGIVDLLIVDGDTAYIVDYKTGNNKYADTKQLKLMALMTYAHFPSVKNIKAGLLFITRSSFVPEVYNNDMISKLWAEFLPSLDRLTIAYENNLWPTSPGPLCGWCPVKSCKFYKEI